MYHFLVQSKAHERIVLLITVGVNIYQTKKKLKYSNSNENMLFWGKTDETISKPPFSKKTPSPPPPFSTSPPISEEFFYDPPLSKFYKKNTPTSFRGELWNILIMITWFASYHLLLAFKSTFIPDSKYLGTIQI